MPRTDTESTQEISNQQLAAPTQQTRGRPARKERKTIPARTPKIQRNNSVADILFEEYERNLSMVSIPFFNSFHALAYKDKGNMDQDYDTQNFAKDSIQDSSQDNAQDNTVYFCDDSLNCTQKLGC